MVFPAEKQLTGLSSVKCFRYYELVFPLPDFFKSLQKCYLEHWKRKLRVSYSIEKVNPSESIAYDVYMMCHSDVFNINERNGPVQVLTQRQTDPRVRSVVSLGSGCTSGVSAPFGKQQMLSSNSAYFPESLSSTFAEENCFLLPVQTGSNLPVLHTK